jgi:hypothetical protein
LFRALGADFDISVRGLGGAMADRWLPDSLTNPLLKHEKAVALDGPNVDVSAGQSPNFAFQTADEQQPSHST